MGLRLRKACCCGRELLLGVGSGPAHAQKKLKFRRTLACRVWEMFSPGPQMTCAVSCGGQGRVAFCRPPK